MMGEEEGGKGGVSMSRGGRAGVGVWGDRCRRRG